MKKTLYFESAGMNGTKRNDVENCRIRTAFMNDKGNQIYLEISSIEPSKYNHFETCRSNIDSCFYITDDADDENRSCIVIKNNVFDTSKKNILNFVNSTLNCSFENIVILENLAGYRVFREDRAKGKFNFSNDFQFDQKLTENRKEVYSHFYNLEKSEGASYPNFSLWIDENDMHLLHLLRHFMGYNKHFSIRTDSENWIDSVEETKLGKYAC